MVFYYVLGAVYIGLPTQQVGMVAGVLSATAV
jgi:hypothetical protein